MTIKDFRNLHILANHHFINHNYIPDLDILFGKYLLCLGNLVIYFILYDLFFNLQGANRIENIMHYAWSLKSFFVCDQFIMI